MIPPCFSFCRVRIDGTGLGLIMHHKKLGKIFEVLCLHIPPKDQTPITDLVKLVKRKIRSEHHFSPNRPIYLVGESVGACLALSVASLNPDIDLVLLLANPATSFGRSPLQPILPLLQFMSELLPNLSLPHVLSSMAGVLSVFHNSIYFLLVSGKMKARAELGICSYLLVLADILPIETLLWKLQIINSASSYANSRLHAVKAQTLILSSGRDPLLPNQEEGLRLQLLLANCEIRTFEDSGHFLFLEDAFDLVTVIKQVGVYRRLKERDFVLDYIPPSPSELKDVLDKYRWISIIMSPVMLSTLADGKIVRGFAGIPSEGPVVYVGYHMLLGFDIFPLVSQLWEQKGIHLRGIAHPMTFMKLKQGNLVELHFSDYFRLMGAVPVSGKNFFKLLSTKSHILLYPGGVREALHRKGEAYKLVWPEQSQFVRMAARFGAKIIPFGAVLFDYEDQMKVPFLKKYIEEKSDDAGKLRATIDAEVGNQAVHYPGILPKFPGLFYYCFGKPIETEESDPYRSLASRLLFQARHGFTAQVPAFDIN
ncbi:putative diacylglycerol acyltransferase, alpha/Beta hydrolase [Rosa chinensis]|uniref:Putative diacylglycerol acyltransferase, alpha/Beta hydrolase n=1 Tax=Rosa chinensis TaxID=74649 RepID=A0A2P6QK94_ROSCH|nr:putative diacylglycerol acyltransferase, alpha/Beta hydrolase [Rosa chinensis]